MEFVDEDIVKRRLKKKMESNNKKEFGEEDLITDGEIIEGMKLGVVSLFGKDIYFERCEILEDKIPVFIPNENLSLNINMDESYQLYSDAYNVSLNVFKTKEDTNEVDLEESKKNIQNELMQYGINVEWKNNGSITCFDKEIFYLEYIISINMCFIHNLIWFYTTNKDKITFCFTFHESDKKYWLPIAKTMMTYHE